jgi:hypothetical protein
VRTAEREERERRRAEARRYPIDDTELLAELREKAYAEGKPPARYTIFLAEQGAPVQQLYLKVPGRMPILKPACRLAAFLAGNAT